MAEGTVATTMQVKKKKKIPTASGELQKKWKDER